MSDKTTEPRAILVDLTQADLAPNLVQGLLTRILEQNAVRRLHGIQALTAIGEDGQSFTWGLVILATCETLHSQARTPRNCKEC